MLFDLLDDSVLKRLKLKDVDTTNWIFKLSANVSSSLFFLAAIIVVASTYIGDPIQCKGGSDFENTLCWIHGTYHITYEKNSKEINSGADCRRQYDGTELGSNMSLEEKESDTTYYQWVPFMLLIHGVIFLLPSSLWNFLEGGLLKHFGTRKETSAVLEDAEITKLAERNAKKFLLLSRKRNNRYFAKYIFCEICNLVVALFNFYLMDIFLGGRFRNYGSAVINHAISKGSTMDAANPMCSAFPTLTNCKIGYGGAVKGSTDWVSKLCILAQNIINQKIYLAIWFWMVLLFIAIVLNAIYRIAVIAVPAFRKQQLVWLIKSKQKNEAILIQKNIIQSQWQDWGKLGNWFILCQLGRGSNPSYFREFLESIAYQNKDTDNSNNMNQSNFHADIEEGKGEKSLLPR